MNRFEFINSVIDSCENNQHLDTVFDWMKNIRNKGSISAWTFFILELNKELKAINLRINNLKETDEHRKEN